MKKVDYFFDFMSPYSFFSWQNVKQKMFKTRTQWSFRALPLASLLNHWGQKGPGEIEPKREYMLKNCFRYAAKNNIQFTTPATHPFNPLYALRMATRYAGQEQQFAVIDTLWKLGWQKGIDLGNPDQIILGLKENNLDADLIYERSFTREAKSEVKDNLSQALKAGVFGVPSFIYQEELFWGNDSLEDLSNSINNIDYWDRDLYNHVLTNTPRALERNDLR